MAAIDHAGLNHDLWLSGQDCKISSKVLVNDLDFLDNDKG